MKTCPNCQSSLPDFLNICTKCKFNLASPPPVKPAASSAPPAPTPSASSVPPRVNPVPPRVTPSPSSSNAAENRRSEPPRETSVSTPQKSSKTMYIVGGVVAVIVVGWLAFGRSGSDEARLAKEQAAAEVAKAKAEASEAHQQAQKAQELADQMKQQAAAMQNAPAAPTSASQVNDLLALAAKCTINDCVTILFKAAQPRNPEAIQVAAGRYAEFNTLKTGDRPAARDLNNKGLAQLRAGNVNGAIDLFSRAANTDPNDSEIMGNYAYALIQAGRLDEADMALNLALLINPRRTATWGALAEYFAKKPNSSEAAVRALQLGYEFSGNREKTLQFFTDNAVSSDRMEMRPIYAEAARRIRAYN